MKVNINPRYAGIRKRARIEMLPLIDIVFLLLVFFIFAMLSMAVHRSLPVALPVSSTSQIDTELHLTVTVKKDGSVYLDKIMLTRQELQVVLRDKAEMALAQDDKSVTVTLFADKEISYQELYSILDIIRTAGISNVSLQASNIR
ncbi:MAG: biopolymer transporter ExbD [Deltaproteobacteria bacterium]|nr:MAG: biopolymer transporter ExbD [Deltaproteobacteria bacterium]